MKANFKHVMIAAALMMGITSCSNDEAEVAGIDNNPTTKSITLKINSGVSTYADQPSNSGNSTQLTGAGDIFFMNAAGGVEKHVDITVGGVSSQTTITVADLNAGTHAFTTISANATKVYVIGNKPAGYNISALTTKAAIEAVLLPLTTQTNVASVTIQGEGAIVPVNATDSKATVNISPVVARFELSRIEYLPADPSSIGNVLTGYKVSGIFVNNFYTQMGLNYTPAAANLRFSDPEQSANFTAANYPAPSSDIGVALGGVSALLNKTPANGTWAYHFFPVDADANGKLPGFVLRLNDVLDPQGKYTNTQFVSVKQFEVGGVEIEKFERNKIYKISAIKFANKHLSEKPWTTVANVTVELTILPWVDVNITPVMP